jgi:hypothetical protein
MGGSMAEVVRNVKITTNQRLLGGRGILRTRQSRWFDVLVVENDTPAPSQAVKDIPPLSKTDIACPSE